MREGAGAGAAAAVEAEVGGAGAAVELAGRAAAAGVAGRGAKTAAGAMAGMGSAAGSAAGVGVGSGARSVEGGGATKPTHDPLGADPNPAAPKPETPLPGRGQHTDMSCACAYHVHVHVDLHDPHVQVQAHTCAPVRWGGGSGRWTVGVGDGTVLPSPTLTGGRAGGGGAEEEGGAWRCTVRAERAGGCASICIARERQVNRIRKCLRLGMGLGKLLTEAAHLIFLAIPAKCSTCGAARRPLGENNRVAIRRNGVPPNR